MWAIPKVTPLFKKRLLDLCTVYGNDYDASYPVVCFDEKSKQLVEDTRTTIPVTKGKPAKYDYEYIRHGTVNLFVAVEPKGKKRYVFVTKHRKKKDFANVVKKLVTHTYKKAKRIIFVTDNLNIHSKKTLIAVFGEKEGKKLNRKIEWHYTPKHASWLNQAELEIHSLSTQCLKRRIPTFQNIQKEVSAWVRDRNNKDIGINWQFDEQRAKEKFKFA
jgi:transposase